MAVFIPSIATASSSKILRELLQLRRAQSLGPMPWDGLDMWLKDFASNVNPGLIVVNNG